MAQTVVGPQLTAPARGRGLGTALGTVLLLSAIGAGIFLRFSHIGKYGFWTDELFHVFAARSYLEDGSLHVPWDSREYTRALPVTLLTVLSFKLLGESEAAARIPFALANVVFILIAYRIIKELFSRSVALIFAISLSLSIFAIQMSQECRMYTLFQLFYFLMSIAFLRGFEPDEATMGGTGFFARLQSRGGVSFKHLAMALGLGLVATSLQKLTLNFVFVVLAYCATMLVHQGVRRGFRGSFRSKYGVALMSVVTLASLLALARPPFIAEFARFALEAPSWNRSTHSNLAFYHRIVTDSHPFLWAIYPVGAFLAVYRHGKKGLFFVLSFCVLFLMHALVFARHSERYIFQILPFFITAGSIGVDFLLGSAFAFASKAALSRWHKALFYAAAGASLSILMVPRIQRTVLDTSVPTFEDWKGLDPVMIETVTSGPSVTTDRLRFNYYFKRYPSYVIDASDVDHAGGEVIIATLADLEKVIARHPDLYLVTYDKHIYRDAFVSAEVRAYILRELDRVDDEADKRIMVFRRPPKEGG